MYVWWIAGLDKIEFLQNHENHEIYQKAFDIIEQYFGSEEEEDRNIAPSANEQQFNFAADMPDAVQSSGFQFWRPAISSWRYSATVVTFMFVLCEVAVTKCY